MENEGKCVPKATTVAPAPGVSLMSHSFALIQGLLGNTAEMQMSTCFSGMQESILVRLHGLRILYHR